MVSTINFNLWDIYYPLIAAGPSPFPAAEKDQNAAAAPDALKVSAQALTIVAAPANAEEGLLMGAASVAYNENIEINYHDPMRIALQ